MTTYDNAILMLLAWVTLAALFFFARKHMTEILVALVLVCVAAAVAVGLWGLFTIIDTVRDRRTMEQCLTAHERRAKAEAAPDDYFGRQLRESAAAEADMCARFAARKEAEEQAKK
jgi:hypothetical protein